MEIKGLGSIISTYKSSAAGAAKKNNTSASVKNTDRVEFSFESALQSARNGIAAEVKAEASPQEIAAAQAQGEISAAQLAGYILLG